MSGNPINQSAVDPVVDAALAAINAAADLASLRNARQTTIGEQSEISKLNATIKNMPNEFKAEAGALIGAARGRLNQAFAAREAELAAVEERAKLAAEAVDV
ncbi:MAG: hypothetical protein RLZZ108_157, partial [Actinomycetota bacterium]